MTTKTCGHCKRDLAPDCFSRVLMRGKPTLRSYCKDCEKRWYRNAGAGERLRRHRERVEVIKGRHLALLAGRAKFTASECGL